MFVPHVDQTEWWRVGQYLDFSPAVWEVAILAIRETLELDTRPLPNLLTMHIRRGDFASWCASGSGCVAPLESYKAAVDELLPELPEDTVGKSQRSLRLALSRPKHTKPGLRFLFLPFSPCHD